MAEKLGLKISATIVSTITLFIFFTINDMLLATSLLFIFILIFAIVFFWFLADKYPRLPIIIFVLTLALHIVLLISMGLDDIIILIYCSLVILICIVLIMNIIFNYIMNITSILSIAILNVFIIFGILYDNPTTFSVLQILFFIGFFASWIFMLLIAAPKHNYYNDLLKLKKRYDNKKISNQEYQIKKEKILKRI